MTRSRSKIGNKAPRKARPTIKNAAPARPRGVSIGQMLRAADRWRESHNPLRSMTISRAVSLMESAQRGDFADLMWLYRFVEMTDAIPFALVTRRKSALAELDTNIKLVDQERQTDGYDEALAKRQRDFLRAAYDRIDNLYEAVKHLALSTFRSYSHVQIHRDEMGLPIHLEPLNQWNFVRNGMHGAWKWNPDAQMTTFNSLPAENEIGADDLRREDFIIRENELHVDRISTIKYIRKNLGEKNWAGFVEVFGVDNAWIIMPPDVPADEEDDYQTAAENAISGGSLPNGSDVKFASAMRGATPFRDYIKYLDEQAVIAGTGGLLTMLTEAGSGTLAGGAHEDTFKSIARAEAQEISEILQEQFDKPLLRAEFGADAPILAYFELAANESRRPADILDDCVKARNAGLTVDPKKSPSALDTS